MNTTAPLHRSTTTDATPPSEPSTGPAPTGAPGHPGGTSWPAGAKALAIFLVVALIAAVVAAIAFANRDDDAADEELRDEVAALTVERDEAIAAAGELESELESARADNEELSESVDELDATVAELSEEAATMEESLATVSADLATVTAERDAFVELFPVEFDVSLAELNLVGVHEVDLRELNCSGFPNCGTLPAIDEVTISRTAEGWLRMSIPDFAEGALIRADGALHMVVASPTAVPPCDGVDRRARVAMTLLPGSYTIADDGVHRVASVDAVMTVTAPETGACASSTAIYGVELTPAG